IGRVRSTSPRRRDKFSGVTPSHCTPPCARTAGSRARGLHQNQEQPLLHLWIPYPLGKSPKRRRSADKNSRRKHRSQHKRHVKTITGATASSKRRSLKRGQLDRPPLRPQLP